MGTHVPFHLPLNYVIMSSEVLDSLTVCWIRMVLWRQEIQTDWEMQEVPLSTDFAFKILPSCWSTTILSKKNKACKQGTPKCFCNTLTTKADYFFLLKVSPCTTLSPYGSAKRKFSSYLIRPIKAELQQVMYLRQKWKHRKKASKEIRIWAS